MATAKSNKTSTSTKKSTTTTTKKNTTTTTAQALKGNKALNTAINLMQKQASAGNASTIDTITPTIYSADQLQSMLGTDITYNRQAIQDVFDAAAKAKYNASLNEQGQAERNYNKNMATAQDTALDTIRQQQGQAVASGASKGMQAANVLSAILGTTQTASDEATKLAQARQQLGIDYGTDLATSAKDALTTANDVGLQLGSLAHNFYADQQQQYASELGYNSNVNTINATNNNTALTNATDYINNLNRTIGGQNQAITNANATTTAAKTQAKGNVNAAKITADAYKNASYGSGSSGTTYTTIAKNVGSDSTNKKKNVIASSVRNNKWVIGKPVVGKPGVKTEAN